MFIKKEMAQEAEQALIRVSKRNGKESSDWTATFEIGKALPSPTERLQQNFFESLSG